MPGWRAAPRPAQRQGSLAIEGNTLSLDQVTAVVEGKRVLGSPREVQEVRGAVAAYERLGEWDPCRREDLLAAHGLLMTGLIDQPGAFRSDSAGIQRGDELVHVAPPAGNVRALINELLAWLADSGDHPLIQACVFHYEFEFIHPFVDGNGRMGRLWQTLILSRWKPLFALVPVESLIRDQQPGYYAALNAANRAGSSTPFIAFMLAVIQQALAEMVADQGTTPKTTQKTTPKTTPKSRPDPGERILALLREHPQASRRQLVDLLGGALSPDGVKYQLARLQTLGRLRHEGSARGGRWLVL